MKLSFSPIAYVSNARPDPKDDHWGVIESIIELTEEFPDSCLEGIDQFSHLEILYFFHQSNITVTGSEHPRENPVFPRVGIFAQRKKDRPNHIGSTIVKLISKEGRRLKVQNLDAIDGTPVIDIKPVFRQHLPQGDIIQPVWVDEMMTHYW